MLAERTHLFLFYSLKPCFDWYQWFRLALGIAEKNRIIKFIILIKTILFKFNLKKINIRSHFDFKDTLLLSFLIWTIDSLFLSITKHCTKKWKFMFDLFNFRFLCEWPLTDSIVTLNMFTKSQTMRNNQTILIHILWYKCISNLLFTPTILENSCVHHHRHFLAATVQPYYIGRRQILLIVQPENEELAPVIPSLIVQAWSTEVDSLAVDHDRKLTLTFEMTFNRRRMRSFRFGVFFLKYTGGSKGVSGTRAPLSIRFLSFSCCQIIGLRPKLKDCPPPPDATEKGNNTILVCEQSGQAIILIACFYEKLDFKLKMSKSLRIQDFPVLYPESDATFESVHCEPLNSN